MKWNGLLLKAFGARSDPNFQSISFPIFLIPLVILMTAYGAYVLLGAVYEIEIRQTCLAASLLFAAALISHLAHPGTARWVTVLGLSAFIMAEAWIWNRPDLFYLLVIPPMLAIILINTFSGFVVAAATSILIYAAWGRLLGLGVFPPHPLTLHATVWLVMLVTAGGYFLIEGMLRHVSEEYERMSQLLNSARAQQVRLSEVLADLEHANRQLSLLFERNISLRKLAEEATEAKSNYIAKVSHEIRTPLSMILGITDLIIENQEDYDENLPLDLLEDIHIIRRNSDHLLGLVNDVLDLTRAESGHLVLKKDWVDINAEIAQSLEIVQPLAKKKRLGLEFRPHQALPLVFCDRTRIRQVIVNLLSNAVRYTEQGQVSAWAEVEEQWLVVQIKDTGPGIIAEDAERIFEPFFRGTNTLKLESSGSGLGLSVSRQLLELHGGKIWLESQPGAGSTFAFRLPVNDPQPPRQAPGGFISEKWAWVERKRRPAASLAEKKKRVLLCEEEDFLSANFAGREELAEFVRVKSIPELIEDANTTPAHLVLVNALTQDELLRKMKQAAGGIKETPLIGCTFTPPREKVMETGALEYVQKPFSIKKLRAVLQRVSPDLKRILIVDDNIEIQHLIARVLALSNDEAEILLAVNGAEALAILAEKQPDVILLDLALPDISGWDLLTRIKKDPAQEKVPVIILSAHDLSDSPPSTPSILLTQHRGFTLEQFIAFTDANLYGSSQA